MLTPTNISFEDFQQQLIVELQKLQLCVDHFETSRPISRLKPRLPDPDKLDGSSYHLDIWLVSVRAKLRIDEQAIGPEPEVLAHYIYDRLDSKVQAEVLPLITDNNLTPNVLFEAFTLTYSDPNKATKAASKLYSFCQDIDSLSVYIAKFTRLLYKTDTME